MSSHSRDSSSSSISLRSSSSDSSSASSNKSHRKSKRDTKKIENKKNKTEIIEKAIPETQNKEQNVATTISETKNEQVETSNEPPIEQVKYLFFKKDDLIKATYNAGNGWSYGGIVENFVDMNKIPRIQGFFPITYVQMLSSGEQGEDDSKNATDQLTPEQQQAAKYEEILQKRQKDLEKIASFSEQQQTFDPHDSYASFAMGSFGNEEALTIEYRRKLLARQLNEPSEKAGVTPKPDDHRHSSGSNPRGGFGGGGFGNKTGNSVQNQKKAVMQSDQSPLAKAYRQINYYFDYENWNDNMNARPPGKGKPNAKFKKKKKFHL